MPLQGVLHDGGTLLAFLRAWRASGGTRRAFMADRTAGFEDRAAVGHQFSIVEDCIYCDVLLADFSDDSESDGLVTTDVVLESDGYRSGRAVQWWGRPDTAFTAVGPDQYPAGDADLAVLVASGPPAGAPWGDQAGYQLTAGAGKSELPRNCRHRRNRGADGGPPSHSIERPAQPAGQHRRPVRMGGPGPLNREDSHHGDAARGKDAFLKIGRRPTT